MKIGSGKHRPGDALCFYVPLAALFLFTLFPFYWMLVTSLKPDKELYNTTINPLLALHPSLEHYGYLLLKTKFLRWMLNSVVVSVSSLAISLVAATLAAYALGRLRFRGAKLIGWAVFITYLVPRTILFLPLAQVVQSLGLQNSLWALIFTHPTFLVPFATWFLIGYYQSIPVELEEAALIDGASRFTVLWRIVIPLAIPGVLAVAIFSFTQSWNEFLYALVFISESSLRTVPIGVTTDLVRGDNFYWGPLMAGALLGSIPVALVYTFFVDYFVSGLTAGAVKG